MMEQCDKNGQKPSRIFRAKNDEKTRKHRIFTQFKHCCTLHTLVATAHTLKIVVIRLGFTIRIHWISYLFTVQVTAEHTHTHTPLKTPSRMWEGFFSIRTHCQPFESKSTGFLLLLLLLFLFYLRNPLLWLCTRVVNSMSIISNYINACTTMKESISLRIIWLHSHFACAYVIRWLIGFEE